MEERKKLKKYASLFLASSLVVGALAGCSGGSGGSSGGSSSGDQGTSTEGSGASGGSSGEVIKIGANLELTGNVASYGSSIAQGAELAIEEINKAGGIDGKQIELIKVDNKSENAEATAAALRLATQEEVDVMIGPATSGNVL